MASAIPAGSSAGHLPADPGNIPDKPALEGLEAKWGAAWEADGTYLFDRAAALAAAGDEAASGVFSIDTPPPTASGSLHIGHVFSYTHMDLIARYQRMRGKNIFYPMGWDDNGLPTERRVQNYYGVRCDPSAAVHRGLRSPARGRRQREQQGRRPGADQPPQLHRTVREAHRRGRAAVRRRSGACSASRVDWTQTYRTIGPEGADRGPARVPAQPRPRRGIPGGCPDPVGRDLPHRGRPGRARRQGAAGRVPPGRVPRKPPTEPERRRAHRDHPAGTARRLRRARRAPRRRALPAALRHDRAHAAVRRRGSRARPPPRPEGQGQRHRDDLHLRRRDRRHLVARTRTCPTARSSAATAGSSPRRPT